MLGLIGRAIVSCICWMGSRCCGIDLFGGDGMNKQYKKRRLALIYGGKSGEHEVSLLTASAVLQELDLAKYDVIPFYISKEGHWQSGQMITEATGRPQLGTGALVKPGLNEGISGGSGGTSVEGAPAGASLVETEASPVQVSPADGVPAGLAVLFGYAEGGHPASSSPTPDIDVAFPLLHGTYGEDGTIQGLLEIANIPYVGAGVLASAIGMDKVMMKKVFAQEGLPQCMYRHFTRNQWEKEREFYLMEIEVSVGYPCFVKPANLGSSVGIRKVGGREQLIDAVAYAFQYDRKVIVEESVSAREIEVSVLGNEDPQASVPGEIVSSNEFYDYHAKYVDGKSSMIIPADLPEATKRDLQQLAIQAFRAIDGSGLSRVDFFVTKDDHRILINEINTMPGFTPFSMYPMLWKESGKPYRELLDDLIELAIERHEDKQKLKYSFDV